MTEQRLPNLPLLETDLLRTFVAIAESGSFTRAAGVVHRTPSAVSMQIRRLEETLGKAVFVRDGRSVYLTPEGEALLGYGRRILRLSEEAVGLFRAPDLEGVVRIGTPDDFGTRFLPNILTRFARTHPAVEVEVTLDMSSALLERLDDGRLDLTLVTTALGPDVLDRGELVFTEPLAWAGAVGGVAYERRPLPLGLSVQGCAWRASALTALDKAGIPYRVAYTSAHCTGQCAAIHADLAVAPFPQSLIDPPLARLDERHGLPMLGDHHIALVRAGNMGQAAEAFAIHVVDSFREIGR